MKTYIYTKVGKKVASRILVTCTIYKIKNNTPIYIGQCKYDTGSTMGADSEVLKELVRLKEVPKRYLLLSKNDWRSAGYYCDEVTDKGITIKGL